MSLCSTDNLLSEGRQRQFGQSEVHFPEWNANDGDVKQKAEKDMRELYPYTPYEKPDNIHDKVQTTRLRFRLLNFCAERPKRKHT